MGAELAVALPRLGEVIVPDRRQLDLAKPDEVRRLVQEVRPSLIVNAAAYTAVDQAETNEAAARALNAEAPAILAVEAKKIGAALVHYSTDYVFDGSKNSPYVEDDPPNPLGVYGKTKLEGELAVRAAGISHLILRTAWVYATRGKNFLLTILRLATEREELRVVCDQVGAPTWSREIARATISILRRLLCGGQSPLSWEEVTGTYHMTAAGATSWFDFTQAILVEVTRVAISSPWLVSAMNGRPLIAQHVLPITTSEYPTPARRPAYSVLSNSLLTKTFGVELHDWSVQLHSAVTESSI